MRVIALAVMAFSSLSLSALSNSRLGWQLSGAEKAVLKGLNSVEISVAGIGQDEETCGIRKSALELAAARPLVDGGIKVAESGSGRPVFHVRVVALINTAGAKPIGCTVKYDVMVHTYATGQLPYQSGPSFLKVLLWDDGGVLAGPTNTTGDSTVADIKSLAEDFVTKVKLANQK